MKNNVKKPGLAMPALIVVLLVINAYGCAYHPGLDGQGTTADIRALTKGRVSFDGVARYEDFHRIMLARLRDHGIHAVPKSAARAHLSMHKLDITRRVLTIGRDVKSRDIELTLTAEFSWTIRARGKKSKTYGPFVMTVRGVYESDNLDRQVSFNELRRARGNLHKQMINRLLVRLAKLLQKRRRR